MSHWGQHIASWAAKNNKKAATVEAILKRKGWDLDKYLPSMEDDLNYYLDQWYELSVKKLPAPATARRRNPFYRRNADVDLRSLERKANESGDAHDIIAYARELDRVGRSEDAQLVRDVLWEPVELDLTFLRDVEIIGADVPEWGLQPQRYDTYTLEEHKAGDFITPIDFVNEWIMAEWGSYEDHDEPNEGHVVNILQRPPLHILNIDTAPELEDLRISLGSNTAGLNQTYAGQGYAYIEGLRVEFPEIYGDMKSAVFRQFNRIQQEFDDRTR